MICAFFQALFLDRRARPILCLLFLASFTGAAAALTRLPAGRGILELEAKQQRKEGDILTLAHFALQTNPVLQPKSDQVRALVGYGEINRRGWNAALGLSYDIRQEFLQNELVQVSYNGACCGIAFEYRRIALGPVRTENQFRAALIIANIGAFGNLRRQEKIF